MFDQNIRYSKTLWHAFVIDDYKLKNLTKLLQDQVGNVTLSADCVHGFSYRFETVGDLIDYENPKSKEIHSISLHAKSDDYSKSVMIVFHRALSSPAIGISLNGCENALPKLLDEIQDVIGGMRPWYDVLSRFPIVYGFGITVLFALIGIFRFKGYISGIIETFEDESREHIFRLILYFSTMLMWFPFYKLLVFVFPPTVFAIGQGKERFNRMKWFHGIIASFIIGLIFFVMKLVIN